MFRDVFSEFIMHNFNEGITTGMFPVIVKNAEIKPIFKKKSSIDKENYRLFSILPFIFKQLMFFEPVFLNSSVGFGKVVVRNTVLFVMIEKWKR